MAKHRVIQSDDGKKITLGVGSTFDFEAKRDVVKIYRMISQQRIVDQATRIGFTLNLRDTVKIGPGGLYLLFDIREKMEAQNVDFKILDCHPQTKRVFDIAEVTQYFEFE